jgi:hypothetical protein
MGVEIGFTGISFILSDGPSLLHTSNNKHRVVLQEEQMTKAHLCAYLYNSFFSRLLENRYLSRMIQKNLHLGIFVFLKMKCILYTDHFLFQKLGASITHHMRY